MDKGVLCIYNGTLLGHRDEVMPFSATQTDLGMITQIVASQKEKDKHRMISLRVEL